MLDESLIPRGQEARDMMFAGDRNEVAKAKSVVRLAACLRLIEFEKLRLAEALGCMDQSSEAGKLLISQLETLDKFTANLKDFGEDTWERLLVDDLEGLPSQMSRCWHDIDEMALEGTYGNYPDPRPGECL